MASNQPSVFIDGEAGTTGRDCPPLGASPPKGFEADHLPAEPVGDLSPDI